MNEDYFPKAHTFNPARFLPPSDHRFDPSFQGKPFPSKHGHAGFGWGRRACPGAEMAINTAKIALTKLLWAFDILPIKEEVYDVMNFVSMGIIRRPTPFRCNFKIRSESHREVVERELIEAERVLESLPPFE